MLQIQLRLRGFRTSFSGKLCVVTRIAKTSSMMTSQSNSAATDAAAASAATADTPAEVNAASLVTPAPHPNSGPPREIGGREGLEPTRFGDGELRGRCIDF
jgi:hypothetical protein